MLSVVEPGEVVGDLLGGDEVVDYRLERLVGIDARLEQKCPHRLVLLGLRCLGERDEFRPRRRVL